VVRYKKRNEWNLGWYDYTNLSDNICVVSLHLRSKGHRGNALPEPERSLDQGQAYYCLALNCSPVERIQGINFLGLSDEMFCLFRLPDLEIWPSYF